MSKSFAYLDVHTPDNRWFFRFQLDQWSTFSLKSGVVANVICDQSIADFKRFVEEIKNDDVIVDVDMELENSKLKLSSLSIVINDIAFTHSSLRLWLQFSYLLFDDHVKVYGGVKELSTVDRNFDIYE